jgi:glutathione S-transferase
MIELYFAPGACSFVPHVGLEAIKAAGGGDFVPKLVKLHKGEHKTPEYLAMNPNGQVPVLVADGKPLTQIVAICDYLDRSFPKAGLLPTEPWARAQAMSQLAWMNNTAHPTFTHLFRQAISPTAKRRRLRCANRRPRASAVASSGSSPGSRARNLIGSASVSVSMTPMPSRCSGGVDMPASIRLRFPACTPTCSA